MEIAKGRQSVAEVTSSLSTFHPPLFVDLVEGSDKAMIIDVISVWSLDGHPAAHIKVVVLEVVPQWCFHLLKT